MKNINNQINNDKVWNSFLHDTRNPLMATYTLLDMLALCQENKNSPKTMKNIAICRSQLDKLKFIISNFCDINRQTSIYVSKEECNISELLKNIKNRFQIRLQLEKKEIKIDCEKRLNFLLDKSILEQLISNMIEHMLTFTSKNSQADLKIIIKHNDLIIDLTYPYPADKEVDLTKIFELENQIKDPNKGHKYNKGFGLTYNKLIAKHVDGDFNLFQNKQESTHTLRLKLKR